MKIETKYFINGKKAIESRLNEKKQNFTWFVDGESFDLHFQCYGVTKLYKHSGIMSYVITDKNNVKHGPNITFK